MQVASSQSAAIVSNYSTFRRRQFKLLLIMISRNDLNKNNKGLFFQAASQSDKRFGGNAISQTATQLVTVFLIAVSEQKSTRDTGLIILTFISQILCKFSLPDFGCCHLLLHLRAEQFWMINSISLHLHTFSAEPHTLMYPQLSPQVRGEDRVEIYI